MHVLIIDDDAECCDLLKTFLESEGFSVRTTLAGVIGLQFVRQFHPALVILDVMMPGMGGREVCQRIRSFSDVPILMMSSVAQQVGEVVQGLNLGADDYLAKPLDFGLLVAKVTALLRRSGMVDWRQEYPIYVDPYLMVDLHCRQVCIGGNSLRLSSLEWQLLELLVLNANQTIPALEIVEKLWPGQVHEDTTSLRSYIKRLRQAIEPEPHCPRYIVSEYGLGYRFATQTDVHSSFTIEN